MLKRCKMCGKEFIAKRKEAHFCSNKCLMRYRYTCAVCGYRNKKTGIRSKTVVAHHILSYRTHINLRCDVNNGITLCRACHKIFHNIYGRQGNKEDLEEFIKIKKSSKNA